MIATVVFPCLDEEAAIPGCVAAARAALDAAGLLGEVLVVDNGSTDGTAAVAEASGARVVNEPRRGYGSAILRGLREARGDFVVVLDADGTYPAEQIAPFVEAMRRGDADFVMGNRFAGAMAKDAMPFLNRYLGNPVLSAMTRILFRVGLTDIHCGMRAIRRSRVEELGLVTPGMEFATEMVVKALDRDLRVTEIGIPYRPRIGPSKLSPVRDAWRHIEHMLVFSPSIVFLWPGTALFVSGTGIQTLLLSGPRQVWFRTWDVHTNLAGLAAALVGVTLLGLGTVVASHAGSLGMQFRHSPFARAIVRTGDRVPRLAGIAMAAVGLAMWGAVAWRWVGSGYGELAAIPFLSLATTFLAAGLELAAVAFIVHVIRLGR